MESHDVYEALNLGSCEVDQEGSSLADVHLTQCMLLVLKVDLQDLSSLDIVGKLDFNLVIETTRP